MGGAHVPATNWSVEHPLCGMDLMITLSLWLFALEHDDGAGHGGGAGHVANKLRMLFDDDSYEVFGDKLSSTVVRLWGSMIDEVVVWGYVAHAAFEQC